MAQIIRTLLETANHAGVALADAAFENQQKTAKRWPQTRNYPPLFDVEFPTYEQLSRRIVIVFMEITRRNGAKVVIQQMNGINIGDPVTDNADKEDSYRFHDAFHLSHAAILGWSPVLRALLKLKRKSDPKKDEVDDGARATVIEEAISNWIFNHSKDMNSFEGSTSVEYRILKAIADLVRGQEVDVCPFWQWETAILEGFKVFRFLREHRGGRVVADLDQRTIEVCAL